MPKLPKVLLFYRNFYPLTGGIETALVEIFSRLSIKGWTVDAITRRKGDLQAGENVEGITVRRFTNGTYSTPLILSVLNLRKYDFIYFNNFEILPGIFVYPWILVLKALGKKNFKVIYSSQGLLNIDKESYTGTKMKIKRIVDNTIGVFLINATVDRIFAVSQHEKNRIIEAGIQPNIISVIHNGVNDEAFSYADGQVTEVCKQEVQELGRYIVQLGRIDRVKNYDAAVRALVLTKEDIQYVIMGPDQDAEYKAELQTLAKELKVEHRVKFIGPKYGVDKFYILKNSKALIHLSKAEGFCLSVLEGMSQGCPCIVSKHPSLTEMVTDSKNGFSYMYTDSRAIAACIDRFVREDQIDIRKNNNVYALQYTWSKISEQTEQELLALTAKAA